MRVRGSKTTVGLAFLFSCLFVYVLIWSKIPEQWPSSQAISRHGWNLFWSEDDGMMDRLSLNLILGNTMKKVRQLELKMTPIPLIYKTHYDKLPKWDFDDVYLHSREARQQVCSKSVQNTKYKEFKKAAIWDIQLWFHNIHLNMSEWNRLAHFNNPFGFMEYNYSDIKKAVDLIPKPKYSPFLQMPKGSKDGCIRCAVVGTGGILNGSRMGKEIDSNDYVFRMNGAIIKGFEEDVGSKTSVYVHTSFSLTQAAIHLTEYGFKIPNDEGIKYVLIPEGLQDYQWVEGLLNKKRVTDGRFKGQRPQTFYSKSFREDQFYVLHPDFLRYIRNRFIQSEYMESIYWTVCRPTNGAFTLFLALHTCDIVNAYGFITEDYKQYSNYYFERSNKTTVIFFANHDYDVEMKTWKKFHDAGIFNLYQRSDQNQTVT